MSDLLDEIKRKLSRLFLGRIVVRTPSELRRTKPTRIMTHYHSVEITPIRAEPRVKAALFVKWKNTKAVSAGSLMGLSLQKNFRIHGIRLGKHKKSMVNRYKLTLKRRAEAKKALRKICKLPIMRRNRLNFIKKQPKFEKASLLALYSPLYQENVARSALDKSSGNLLFWYDSNRVKMGQKYHLLLLRVFGGEEPLKWLWLPADKKIH